MFALTPAVCLGQDLLSLSGAIWPQYAAADAGAAATTKTPGTASPTSAAHTSPQPVSLDLKIVITFPPSVPPESWTIYP